MNFGLLPPGVDRWVALRMAARREKSVARDLAGAGLRVFMPVFTRQTKYKKDTKSVELPLFGGYVFCEEADLSRHGRVPTETRRHIAQIIRPPDFAVLRKELETIAAVTASHSLIQERVFGHPGDRVVIAAGSMAGSEGVILQLKPNQRSLVLEISFLNARLEVEIDEALVVKR